MKFSETSIPRKLSLLDMPGDCTVLFAKLISKIYYCEFSQNEYIFFLSTFLRKITCKNLTLVLPEEGNSYWRQTRKGYGKCIKRKSGEEDCYKRLQNVLIFFEIWNTIIALMLWTCPCICKYRYQKDHKITTSV